MSLKKLIFIFSLFFIIFLIPSYATDISSCSNLDIEGETYYLTNDIIDTSQSECIKFLNNSITLDCQGYIIDGDGANNIRGIVADGLSNLTIRNCILSDSINFGIEISNSNNILIENCSIRNIGMRGIYLRNVNNVLVNNNFLENIINDGGIVVEYNCSNIIIENNTLINCGKPGGTNRIDEVTNFIFRNNYIKAPNGWSLRINNNKNGIIENNYFEDYGTYGFWFFRNRNITIKDNVKKGGFIQIGLDNFTGSLINNTFIPNGTRMLVAVYNIVGLQIWRNNNFTDNGIFSIDYDTPEKINYIDIDTSNYVKNLPIYILNNASDIDGLNTYVLYCNLCNNTIKNLYFNMTLGISYSNVTIDNIDPLRLQIQGSNGIISNSKFDEISGPIIYYPSNIIIKNSEINGTLLDIFLRYNTTLTLINVSMKPNYTYSYDNTSKIIRKWYIDISIISKIIPFLTIKDSKNNLIFSGNSYSYKTEAIEYIATCPNPLCPNTGEVRDYYSPYTLEAKAPHYLTLSKTNNLTNNWIESYPMFPTTLLSEIPVLALILVIIPFGVILIILRKLFSEFSIANVIAILIIVVLMVVLLGILISIPAI